MLLTCSIVGVLQNGIWPFQWGAGIVWPASVSHFFLSFDLCTLQDKLQTFDLFTWPRCFLQICIKAHILPGEWCTQNVQGKFLQDFKLEEKIKILIVLSCLPWMAFIVLGASNTRLRCTRPHPPIVSPPIILSSKLIFALSLSSGEFLIFIGPESDHWECLSVTDWLLFSKLDWCDSGMWRWQLKTCWSCYCC